MTKMRFSTVFMAILVCVFVSACSSSGTVDVTTDRSQDIPPGSSASLSVTSTAEENPTDVIQRLRGALFERLVTEEVFGRVLHPHEAGDYRMDVVLGEVNEVSRHDRVLLGVFAGANTLDAAVSLHEVSTRRLVTAFHVSGSSASHPMASGTGMADAIQEAVAQIILALK